MTKGISHMGSVVKRFILVPFLGVLVVAFLTTCAQRSAEPVWYPRSGIKYTDGYAAVKAAADSGDPEAMYILAVYAGIGEEGKITYAQKRKYLVMAAEHKHRWAQEDLALYYRNGTHGFPQDSRKAIYWMQRTSCDYTIGAGGHWRLADLYSGMDHHLGISAEERALVQKNLPLAYAHLQMGGPVARYYSDDMEALMTEEEIEESEKILELFKSGGCPYGD